MLSVLRESGRWGEMISEAKKRQKSDWLRLQCLDPNYVVLFPA